MKYPLKIEGIEYDLTNSVHLQTLTSNIANMQPENQLAAIEQMAKVIIESNNNFNTDHLFHKDNWLSHLILSTPFERLQLAIDQEGYDFKSVNLKLFLDGIQIRDEQFEIFMEYIANGLKNDIKLKYSDLIKRGEFIESEIENRAEKMLNDFCERMYDKSYDAKNKLMSLWWQQLYSED